ncbi:accessory gene regulator ArgB-like protein [Caldanaerobius polysaccharolyticus]|uniref:accessory gene regulator ArgB-like protein n=1 Tax=Caldanaerobius polysaccharolyticus TaxID=44256 RepID=UPI000478E6E0|nr:accessory gene regulator B family protein [Caldanaerobius polysaccharolyticus]
MEEISRRVLIYICSKIPLTDEQKDYVYFGLQLILESFVEIITILVVAYVIGIFKETFVLLLVAGGFKLISGGAHCNTFGSCYAFSLIVYPIAGLILRYIIMWNVVKPYYMYIAFAAVLLVCYFYAPAQVAAKPIAYGLKKRYKIISMALATAIFALAGLFYVFDYKRIAVGIVTAVVYQSLFIAPLGFKITKAFDALYNKIVRSGLRGR